jgi:hypothetical protein
MAAGRFPAAISAIDTTEMEPPDPQPLSTVLRVMTQTWQVFAAILGTVETVTLSDRDRIRTGTFFPGY